MADSKSINYAEYVGINSVIAAAVFAGLYAPLLAYFVFRVFKNTTMTLFMMCLFCQVRLVAFAMRAYIAASDSAQHNQDLIIAESIIYGVGFFGLLYSAYSLTIDRKKASGRPDSNIITRLSGNIHLVHLALTAAVVLSIIGTIKVNSTSGNPDDASLGKTLRLVSAIIFVSVSGLLVLRCAFNLREDASLQGKYRDNESIGEKHGQHILLLISIVLAVREVYLVITVNNAEKQRDEKLFYILEAVPELLAVLLFATPGLIPDKRRGEIIPTYEQHDSLLMNGRR